MIIYLFTDGTTEYEPLVDESPFTGNDNPFINEGRQEALDSQAREEKIWNIIYAVIVTIIVVL